MMASLSLRPVSACLKSTTSSMTFASHQSTRRYYILTSTFSHLFSRRKSAVSAHFRYHLSLQRRSFQTSPYHQNTKYPITTEAMEAVKQTIAQNLGVKGAHGLVPEDQQFSLEQTPDLSGKVAVITGGSEGIGYGAVYTFLTRNIAKIFVISISKDVIDQAVKAIAEELGDEKAKRLEWIQADLSDWKKTAQVAKQIRESTDRLDILVNNAARGIMTYQLTDYGVDRHMAVNHFAPVILTSHLLPLLKSTAKAGHTVRISNQASNAHQATPSSTQFASLDELNTDLGPNGQYGRSKLAAILYSRYLNKHLTSQFPNILANATHPGFVDTAMSTRDIHEPYPLLGYGMSAVMKPVKKDIMQGCVSTVFAATKTERSGEYICPPAVPESGTEKAQDEELGEQLMKLTVEVVKEKTREDSVEKGCPFNVY